MRRESSIERWVNKEAVRRLGVDVIKLKKAGLLDRLYLLHGGAFALIEYKDPGGELSSIQELTIKRLTAMGHEVRVFDDREKALLYLELKQQAALETQSNRSI